MKKKTIAIVGRPNVGKSTFVNRIIGKRQSIVDDMAGVTRDRIYFDAEWQNKPFVLIDTGGIVSDNPDEIENSIYMQVQIAIEEADEIIFMTDGLSGINPCDTDIANMLRKTEKPVLLVVNKIDSLEKVNEINDFYSLGLGNPHPLSSLHGTGTVGDLLDIITCDIEPEKEEKKDEIKIAIAGKPNAGKSSIVNAILGEKRVIVSEISGTTRDSINSTIIHKDKRFTIIDTAGIRKKTKVDYGVEAFAVDRAIRSIKEADVTLLVVDCTEGITEQDKRILQIIIEAGRAVVLAFNKWDLIKNEQTHIFEQKIKAQIPYIDWIEKIFISAKTGQRVDKIFDEVSIACENYTKRVSTSILNKIMMEAITMSPPVSSGGKRLKVYYTTQVKTSPPTFVLFVNNDKLIKDSYKKYLEKRLREAFGFFSTPIRILFRAKKEKERKEGKKC